jgi:hypothetical protein
VFALSSRRYGLEVSFGSMPGSISVPPFLARQGLRVTVRRFKFQAGVVRRVRKNIVHVVRIETANGPGLERIHDHVLIGYHLFERPYFCPGPPLWPWQIQVGFPAGLVRLSGAARCY